MSDEDYCYECMTYGDNYYEDDDGELVCLCQDCKWNPDYDYWDG